MPNNQTVTISSFGGDELGRSGVTGQVDTRFGSRFGSAALISVISALPGGRPRRRSTTTPSAEVLEDVGDDLSDSTGGVIDEYLSIGPVIYVDQGSRITVIGGPRSGDLLMTATSLPAIVARQAGRCGSG